jgi:acyl carrier protein
MITVDDVCELIRKRQGGKVRADQELNGDTVFDELGLSSLQIADIVYTIEDRLGIEFDPARAADVKTVGDLVNLANEVALAPAADAE